MAHHYSQDSTEFGLFSGRNLAATHDLLHWGGCLHEIVIVVLSTISEAGDRRE